MAKMDVKAVCKNFETGTCYRFLAKKEIEVVWSTCANVVFSGDVLGPSGRCKQEAHVLPVLPEKARAFSGSAVAV
jgi:hypothetical protein